MGDRLQNLKTAIQLLQEGGFELLECSAVYETPPWGFEAGTTFYNICFSGHVETSPTKFIDLLIATEEKMGRVRHADEQYTSRNIDLDIILWDKLLIDSPVLQVPHPRAHQRRFVLEPAVEIAAGWLHPFYNKDLKTLLDQCPDNAEVQKLFAMEA